MSVSTRAGVVGAGLAAALLLSACSSPTPEPAADGGSEAGAEAAGGLDVLASARLVDLTYEYGDETIFWPTSPTTFRLNQIAYGQTDGGFFYSAYTFCTAEHGGTHLDSPIHFAADRPTVDEIPLESLVGPAVVIDVSEQASWDADYLLTAADVLAWEEEHGEIPADAIVLLRTGWGARWPDRLRYLGDDTPGDASDLHFPSFGEESAQLLVEERGIAVLGVDTASIDHGPSTDFLAHRIAAAAGVPGLENVANLDQLPATGAWVIALPMKIAGGSGAPVRIVALLPCCPEAP